MVAPPTREPVEGEWRQEDGKTGGGADVQTSPLLHLGSGKYGVV